MLLLFLSEKNIKLKKEQGFSFLNSMDMYT